MMSASTTLSTPVLKKAIDRYYKELQDYKAERIRNLPSEQRFSTS
jgi:hypothetical protein